MTELDSEISKVPASSEVVRHRNRRRALAFALGLAITPVVGWGFDQVSTTHTDSTQAAGCFPGQYGPEVPCPADKFRLTEGEERAATKVGVACMVGAAATAGEPIGCAYGAIGAVLDMVASAI